MCWLEKAGLRVVAGMCGATYQPGKAVEEDAQALLREGLEAPSSPATSGMQDQDQREQVIPKSGQVGHRRGRSSSLAFRLAAD